MDGRVERRSIDGLLPYARNARTHSEEQVTQIAASIQEWAGRPLCWWTSRGIIARHGRVEAGHGTQKPVECMRRPIENNSSPDQAVYEPFCGSGTTIIAAEMTGCSCYAIEISPGYVDVAMQRQEAFTGHAATLDGDGSPFDEIALQRRQEAM